MGDDGGGAGGGSGARLRDLVAVVGGAAVVLDLARRASAAQGGWGLARGLGLLVFAVGIGLALIVAGQLGQRWRGARPRGGAIAWRVGVLAGLGWMLAGLAGALLADGSPYDEPRLQVATLQAVLGLVGLALAVRPAGPSRPRRPSRWALPSVVAAVAAGLTLVVLAAGIIPYLVLIAIEAVQNALTRGPLVRRPILFDRMATTALAALPGFLGCMATATWVDDDLRAALRDPIAARRPWGRAGLLARAGIVAVAAGGSAYLALAAIPALSPSLAEGITAGAGPGVLASLGLGYAGLALGLAARGAAALARSAGGPSPAVVPPERPFGPWPRRLLGLGGGLVAAEFAAAAIDRAGGRLGLVEDRDRWWLPISLGRWIDWAHAPLRWVDQPVLRDWPDLVQRPDAYLVAAGSAWLLVALARLAWARGRGEPAALDVVAGDRLATGRLLGWWAALAVALLGSLPGFVAIGLELVHRVVFALSR